jgi:hypothetical protein
MTNLPNFDPFRNSLVLLRDKLADDLLQMQQNGDNVFESSREFFLTRKRLNKTSDLLRSMKSFREAFED